MASSPSLSAGASAPSSSSSSASASRRSRTASSKRSLISRFSMNATPNGADSPRPHDDDDDVDVGLWDKNETAFLQEAARSPHLGGSRPSSSWTSSSNDYAPNDALSTARSPTSALEELVSLRGSTAMHPMAAAGSSLSPSMDSMGRASMASSGSQRSSARRIDSSSFSDTATTFTYPTTISSDSFERPRRAPKAGPSRRSGEAGITVPSMPAQWKQQTPQQAASASPHVSEAQVARYAVDERAAVNPRALLVGGMLLPVDADDSDSEGSQASPVASGSLRPPTSRLQFPQTPTEKEGEESWLDYGRDDDDETDGCASGQEEVGDVTAVPADLPRSSRAIPPTLADSLAAAAFNEDGDERRAHPYRVMEVERGSEASGSTSEEESRRRAHFTAMMEKPSHDGAKSDSPRVRALLRSRRSKEPVAVNDPTASPASSPSLVAGIKKLMKSKKKAVASPQGSPQAASKGRKDGSVSRPPVLHDRQLVAAVLPSPRHGASPSIRGAGSGASSSDISSFAMSPPGSRRPSDAFSGPALASATSLSNPRRDSTSRRGVAPALSSPPTTGSARGRAHPPRSTSQTLARKMATATPPPAAQDVASWRRRPSLISLEAQDGNAASSSSLRRFLSGGGSSGGRRDSTSGSIIEHISHDEARRRSGSLHGPVLQYGSYDPAVSPTRADHVARPSSRSSLRLRPSTSGASGGDLHWNNPWDSSSRVGHHARAHGHHPVFAASTDALPLSHAARVRRGSATSATSGSGVVRRGSASMSGDVRRRLSSLFGHPPSTTTSRILPQNISRPVSVVGSTFSNDDGERDPQAFIRPPSAMSGHRENAYSPAMSPAANGVLRRPSTASSTMASSRIAGIQRGGAGFPPPSAVSDGFYQDRRRPSTSDNPHPLAHGLEYGGFSPPTTSSPRGSVQHGAARQRGSVSSLGPAASVFSLPATATYTRRPTFGLDLQPDAAAAFDSIPSPEVMRIVAAPPTPAAAGGGVRSTVASSASASSAEAREQHRQGEQDASTLAGSSIKTNSFDSSFEAGEEEKEDEEGADETAREETWRRLTLNDRDGTPTAVHDGFGTGAQREELLDPRPPLLDAPLSPGLRDEEFYTMEQGEEYRGFGLTPAPAPPLKTTLGWTQAAAPDAAEDEQHDVVEILV